MIRPVWLLPSSFCAGALVSAGKADVLEAPGTVDVTMITEPAELVVDPTELLGVVVVVDVAEVRVDELDERVEDEDEELDEEDVDEVVADDRVGLASVFVFVFVLLPFTPSLPSSLPGVMNKGARCMSGLATSRRSRRGEGVAMGPGACNADVKAARRQRASN